MSNYSYVGGGVFRSVSKPKAYTGPAAREEKKKPHTILGVEVDEATYNRYKMRAWDINGKEYSLLGVMLWATSKEIATAYPEDAKAARAVFASILDELEPVNADGVNAARRKLDNTAIEITGERMMKGMRRKNFGGYLEDIDAIYKADRKQRETLDANFKQLKAEYEAITKAHPRIDDPERVIAQGNLLAAERKYKTDIDNLAQKHTKSINAVRNEMAEHLTEFYRADPGKLDEKAMQFLNSGIATPGELEHLAGQFKSNPTMLRMIGQHAKGITEKYSKGRSTAAGNEKYLKLLRLGALADGLTTDVASKDELAIFNGLAAFAERGVTRDAYQGAGFAAKWDQFYNEAVDKMQAVDRLAE